MELSLQNESMKVILVVVVMSLLNVFCDGDICQDVTCQHGGTCVLRTDDFWWCECDRGWTGKNCEQNACEKKKYLRVAGHSLDKLGGDMVHLKNTDPYSCMERCEKFPELFDLPICKAFFFQFSSKECGHWLNLDHSVVTNSDRDFYIYCDCNNHFDQNQHFNDSVLSPTCYMTNTSSVVQLTCPDGFVFAENKASTIEVECECGEDTGYLAITATCLSPCDVQEVICLNGGKCVFEGSNATCQCTNLTTGNNCETLLSVVGDTTVDPNQAATSTAENDQSTAFSTTPATCEEAFVGGSTSTGVKTLQYKSYSFKAFCIYNTADNTGWFYPSTEAVKNNETFTLNLDSQYSYRDQARVRIFLKNGDQKDSTLEQLTMYKPKNLTFMVNSASGFAGPANANAFSHIYLYLGFLEKSIASIKRSTQGWRADGSDITFRNCNGHPNSYFVLYPTLAYSSAPRGLGSNYPTTKTWRSGVNDLDIVIPEEKIPTVEVTNFLFTVEIHMGGCGVIEVSTDWSTKATGSLDSQGAVLGLKFYMSDECIENPCGSHGQCTDKVNSFICTCDVGWTGLRCDQAIQTTVSTIGTSGESTESTSGAESTPATSDMTSTASTSQLDIGAVESNEQPTPDFARTPSTGVAETTVAGNCSILPEIEDSISPKHVSALVLPNQSVTIRCKRDYYFQDKTQEVTVTCKGNNTWTEYEHACQRYFCPTPPVVKNAVIIGDEYKQGSTVVYKCKKHYSLKTAPNSDEYSIRCKYLIWRGLPVPNCIRRRCEKLVVGNADLHTTNRTAGTWVKVKCHPGYYFPDRTNYRSMICQTNGEWHTKMPDCAKPPPSDGSKKEKFVCPQPPYLPNGRLVSAGDPIILECMQGSRFYDGEQRHKLPCDTAINMVERPPYVCVAITCPPLPVVNHTVTNTSAAISGTVVKYDCERGYWFPDKAFSRVIKCNNASEWYGDLLEDCIETYCPDLSLLAGVQVEHDNISVGAEVEISCNNPDHRFLDGKKTKQLRCQRRGKWNELVSNCSDDRCSAIPEVDHAKASTIIAQYGTNVTYQCNMAYEFPDKSSSVTIYCDRVVQAWSASVTDCQVVLCPSPPDVTFAKATLLSDDTSFNSTVVYTCIHGFMLASGQDSFRMTCASNGSWLFNSNNLRCIAVSCPAIDHFGNGTLNTTASTYGTYVQLQCSSGYEMTKGVETKVVHCLRNAAWSSEIARCSLKRCPPVATWSGLAPDKPGPHHVGAKINYTCATNYTFEDGTRDFKVSRCNADGQWKPAMLNCQEIVDPTYAEIPATEAPDAQMYGIVAGVVIGFVILIIIIIDIISLTSSIREYILEL